jgi:hypothetical protein
VRLAGKRQARPRQQAERPNNKIGRGLTDHPTYFYKIQHELPQHGSLGWIGSPHGHAKILIQQPWGNPDRAPYNIELLINGKYWDARHADDALWRQLLESDPVSRVEIKFIFGSALDDGNSITLGNPEEKPNVFVRPNPTGSEDIYKAEVLDVRNRVLSARASRTSARHGCQRSGAKAETGPFTTPAARCAWPTTTVGSWTTT